MNALCNNQTVFICILTSMYLISTMHEIIFHVSNSSAYLIWQRFYARTLEWLKFHFIQIKRIHTVCMNKHFFCIFLCCSCLFWQIEGVRSVCLCVCLTNNRHHFFLCIDHQWRQSKENPFYPSLTMDMHVAWLLSGSTQNISHVRWSKQHSFSLRPIRSCQLAAWVKLFDWAFYLHSMSCSGQTLCPYMFSF